MPSNTGKWNFPRPSPYEQASEDKEPNGDTVPTKPIGVRVLLVSDDIETIDTLCHYMEQMTMHVEVCSDITSAARKLCHAKFEAIVVDFNNPAAALDLIKKPREMTSHKGSVVIAVLNSSNEMPSAFRAGASFALVKPLLPAILMRTLRASYPLMVRERRRSYRCPLQISVQVSSNSHPDFVATSVNISEGGMAVTSPVQLQVGERVNLKFTLPEKDIPARISGEICWTDETGRLGLEFVQVPAPMTEHLQSWLATRLEECLPC
jgi:DNA-binding response OmpR family regulator